jgi:DNA processing protein
MTTTKPPGGATRPASRDATDPAAVARPPAIDEVRAARIVLAHLAEPGRRDLGELVRAVGPVEALARIRAGRVPAALREVTAARMSTLDLAEVPHRAVAEAARVGARIVTPEDDEWPAQLDELVVLSRPVADPVERDTDPPHCVWVRGPLALREACERSVAVVGARASTAYGDHVAADLAYGLAERGWTVVSGGAFGIDAAAHRGALAAAGRTIAVLACGVDRCYPASHRLLFDRIAETGLIFSEWPLGADPHRHRFLVRNRVIAALARGTVVVEAALRSGARSTLRRARQLGRMAMVVPGPVTSALSAGAHEELREPGTVLVARTAHVVDAVGAIGADLAPVARAEPTARDALTRLERQVLDGVRPRKILTAEEIARAVGVSPREARATLPSLVQAKFVTAVDGGYRLWRRSDDEPPARRTRRAASTGETARAKATGRPASRHRSAQHQPAARARQSGRNQQPTGEDGPR